MSELVMSTGHWIRSINHRVQASKIKAALALKRELLELYWFLGNQQSAQWGAGILDQMSQVPLTESPKIKGVSRRNLFYMRKWDVFCSGIKPVMQQAAAQLAIDGPNVSTVICKSKSDITVRYSLHNLNRPSAVSKHQITENWPEQLRSSRPSTRTIETELGGFDDE